MSVGRDSIDSWAHSLEGMNMCSFFSCWHANEHQSVAMWKIYGTTQGLAIETNLAQLKAAFATATEVYIDPVRYADPSDEIDSETSFIRLKRKSFEYEKEVRVIVVALGPETGMYIQINVAALIQAVHLHPDSPEWLRETVEHVSQRYGHHFPVRVSELNKLG